MEIKTIYLQRVGHPHGWHLNASSALHSHKAGAWVVPLVWEVFWLQLFRDLLLISWEACCVNVVYMVWIGLDWVGLVVVGAFVLTGECML